MDLTEQERLVIELVRETARYGVEEVAKYTAPLLDRLIGEDCGPYASPSSSPYESSLAERLEGLRSRGHVRVKTGDTISPGMQAKFVSDGQPLPKMDSDGRVVGPPSPQSTEDLLMEQARKHKSSPPLAIAKDVDAPNAEAASPPTPEQIAAAQRIIDQVEGAQAFPRFDAPAGDGGGLKLRRTPVADMNPTGSGGPDPRNGDGTPAPNLPSIADLDIHKTAREAMIREGITDLSHLENYPKSVVRKLKGLGPGSLAMLATIMRHEGVRFKREPDRRVNRKRG